jgi:hypothetical protein
MDEWDVIMLFDELTRSHKGGVPVKSEKALLSPQQRNFDEQL